MREGAYFINTARGELVDQAALAAAIRERKLRVGLDVYAGEPTGGTGPFSDPLGQEPNVYGTHHIGASTEQAQEAIAAETVRIIQTFKATGHVPNVVQSRAAHSRQRTCSSSRHLDRPGVLAGILDGLRASEINVQEMETPSSRAPRRRWRGSISKKPRCPVCSQAGARPTATNRTEHPGDWLNLNGTYETKVRF